MKKKAISLKMLLIITNVILSIIIVVSVTLLLSNYIRSIIYENAMVSTEKTLSSIARNIEYKIVNHIYENLLDILHREDLIVFLNEGITKYDDERERLIDIFLLNKMIGNTADDNRNSVVLSAIANKKDYLYLLHDPYYENSLSSKVFEYMKRNENPSDIRVNWYPLQLNPFARSIESIRDDYVVIVSENIMNVRTGEYNGKQIYTINENDLYKIYSKEELLEYGEIRITDEKGNLISHSNLEKLENHLIKNEKLEEYNKNVLVFSREIDNSNWVVTAAVPQNYIYKGLDKVYYINLLLVIGVTILSVVVVIIISNRIVRPFKTMIHSMEKVQAGDFDNLIVEEGCQEVRSLMKYYNHMIIEINHYIMTEHELTRKKKAAELDALFAQINPHFLYNTLESIIWKARKIGATEIEDMVYYLGKFFNLIVNKGHSRLTIAKELEHVKMYLNIQNIRSKNKIDYQVTVEDERIYQCLTIKLILQPIIENTIIHGFKQIEGATWIHVNVTFVDDMIEFRLVDNGQGMSKQKVNEINQILENTKLYEYDEQKAKENIKRNSGIGLININQRIKLYYGNEYGIKVCYKDEGSEVRIRIPINYNKSQE